MGLSIFKVEHTEPPTPEQSWRKNHTTWVLIDGDAADAICAVKHQRPDDVVHNVRRHATGASVLVVDGEGDS